MGPQPGRKPHFSSRSRGLTIGQTLLSNTLAGRISYTPEALPLRSFLTTSVTSAWVMKESNPESLACVSTRECMTAGLRRSSKYSFPHPIMSPVEVSSSPTPL
ncbi:hypothetical protein ATANTOWER_028161 [Ataeniobius toweri]|uniref:Uncharacterized protein n=1 Tax=Ataeniobius toweri TaxID=208326 RepID=A0ABU7BLE6_9TELE|nr:hypothetical protein [Ataeniobius toweri]